MPLARRFPRARDRAALLFAWIAIGSPMASCGGATSLDGESRPDTDAADASPPARSIDGGGEGTVDATIGEADAARAPSPEASVDASLTPGTRDAAGPDAATCGPCAGTCFGARCLTVLASNQANPGSIAVTSRGVYWTNEGRPDTFYGESAVMFVGLGGGTPATIASTAGSNRSMVVADADSVVWLDRDGIVSVPAASPSLAGTRVADRGAAFVAMDAAGIYWTHYVSYAPQISAVSRMDFDGGNQRELMQRSGMPEEVLVHDGVVYWQTYESYATSFFAVDAQGRAPRTLAAGLPSGLFPWAIQGGNLYWAETIGPLGISRMSLTGGPAVVVATAVNPAAMTADATNLYFTNDNTVYAMAPSGSPPIALTWKLPSPYAIAVDADSVYWTDYGKCDAHGCTGAIMKLTPK